MVPCARGKWLGNADVLKTMQHNFTYGYPGVYTLKWVCFAPFWQDVLGDGLSEMIEERGPVVNLRVFWSDLLLTTSPEHLKLILATDFDNYVKGQNHLPLAWAIRTTTLWNAGTRFQRRMEDFLGIGVFNSDGKLTCRDFISENDASLCRRYVEVRSLHRRYFSSVHYQTDSIVL